MAQTQPKHLAQVFRVGFRHGATGRAPDMLQVQDYAEAYRRGYFAGQQACAKAYREYCDEVGHNPQNDVLRED